MCVFSSTVRARFCSDWLISKLTCCDSAVKKLRVNCSSRSPEALEMHLPNPFIEYKLDAFHRRYLILIKICPKLSLTALKFPEFCHLRWRVLAVDHVKIHPHGNRSWLSLPRTAQPLQLDSNLAQERPCLEKVGASPEDRMGFESHTWEVQSLHRGLQEGLHHQSLALLFQLSLFFRFLICFGGRSHVAQAGLDLIVELKWFTASYLWMFNFSYL